MHPAKAFFAEYDKDITSFAQAVADTQYELPYTVAPLWQALNPSHILDIGCGWGTNAIIDSGSTIFTAATSPTWDGQWHSHIHPGRRRWTGVDVAGNATHWCEATGLYQATITCDLTREALVNQATNTPVELVLATGSAGYIGAQLVDHVTPATDAAWMFTLLAWEDTAAWREAFAAQGRAMQRIATVPQRRILSPTESETIMAVADEYVHQLGAAGWVSAHVWYVRPA